MSSGPVAALASSSDAAGSLGHLTCFSELADCLACDPSNTTWVYGVYTYKYDVPQAQAQAHVRQLVDRMLARAARHYAESVVVYRRLSASERRAHVLHGVAPVSRPIELPFFFVPRAHAVQGTHAAAPASSRRRSSNPAATAPDALALPEMIGSGGTVAAPDEVSSRPSLVGSQGGSGRRRTSLSVSRAVRVAHSVSQEDAVEVLTKQWPSLSSSPESQVAVWLEQNDKLRSHHRGDKVGADGEERHGGLRRAASRETEVDGTVTALPSRGGLAPGADRGDGIASLGVTPRVRLVIDIVASRKTLGATADITESAPYQLGQDIYDDVQRRVTALAARPLSQDAHVGVTTTGDSEGDLAREKASWFSENVDTVAAVVLRHLFVTVTTVTISDTSNKLAGRDVLFPRRSTTAAAGSALAVARHVNTSPFYETSAMNAAAIDQLLGASTAMALLFPSHGARLPPVQKELIDQSRIVICFPRMASMRS